MYFIHTHTLSDKIGLQQLNSIFQFQSYHPNLELTTKFSYTQQRLLMLTSKPLTLGNQIQFLIEIAKYSIELHEDNKYTIFLQRLR